MTKTNATTAWKATEIDTASVEESHVAAHVDLYASLNRVLHYDVRSIASPDQAWFWTAEWQDRERYADKDITNGHTSFFETSDDLFGLLDDGGQ